MENPERQKRSEQEIKSDIAALAEKCNVGEPAGKAFGEFVAREQAAAFLAEKLNDRGPGNRTSSDVSESGLRVAELGLAQIDAQILLNKWNNPQYFAVSEQLSGLSIELVGSISNERFLKESSKMFVESWKKKLQGNK